jgi:DNA-binding winged helix-turn-helix (wHTH) protein/Tol biopolymer transport system component
MDQFARLTPSEPITLIEVPDFELGGLLVRPSLRRVSAAGREDSVEPRVMQVLIALAQAGGTVVSRDGLTDRCWGGRIVGEDAINRCIAKVRKLAELTEPPAFAIETVAKVGYLLNVPHAPIPPQRAIGQPPAHQPRAKSRRFVWGLPAVIMIVAAGAAAAFWLVRPQPHWTVQASHNLLPKLEGETSPRISPNGAMLAYAVNVAGGHGRIFVRNLHGGRALPVSAPDENADSPAWASDNVHLAYVVIDPKGGPCRIMSTIFPGGTPQMLGRCRHLPETQIAWQPGAPFLFFKDDFAQSFGAIFRLNIETGQSEQMSAPRTAETDYSARISPDGKYLAYIRSRGFPGSALRLRNLADGEERELPCDPDINAVDWAPDSQTLIASVSSMMGSEILAYPIDGAPGYRVYASAATLGRLATGPDGMLAVDVADGRFNLARAHTTKLAAPDIVDVAAGVNYWPAFSPDGTLAFVSNRSGETGLWIRKPGREPVELVSAGLTDIARPVWSPDGTRIAYMELWKGTITAHVITAQGENIASFTGPSIGFGMPNWTPDGQHLLIFDRRIFRAVRVDLRNPADREPVEDKFWDGLQYWRGALYSTRGEKPGIWQLDGSPRLITANYPAGRSARLAFIGDDVLMPGRRDGNILQILAQPLKGGEARTAYYAPSADPYTPFAVDPLTGDVIYVTEDPVETHIDVLTMARQ